MFEILKFLIPIICIIGIIYIVIMKSKYKNDKTSLSKEIVKNPYILMMVQDKTLSFQKGKYYLNK